MAVVVIPLERPKEHSIVIWSDSCGDMQVDCETCNEEVISMDDMSKRLASAPLTFDFLTEIVEAHKNKQVFNG